MTKPRPDVLEILELEKEYHAVQIRRISMAITALKGEVPIKETTQPEQPSQKTTEPVQWTSEIKDVFQSGEVLSVEDVRNKLIEKGIVEAMTDRGKNSIYSTFSRLKKSGFLEKSGYGKYRRKRREIIRRNRQPETHINAIDVNEIQ